jgi:2-haloacid dehalogenase
MNIRAIIFDLGGVLIEVAADKDFRRIFGWSAASSTRPPRVFERIYRRFSSGKISPRQFYQKLLPHLSEPVSYGEFCRLWCSLLRPRPGAEKIFLQVRQNLPLGLLSDTDPLHWSYARKTFGFLRLIGRPTLSFRTGLLKPHPRAFRIAASRLGMKPGDCLFIDDKPANVQGARRAGMQALRCTGVRQLAAELKRLGLISDPNALRAPAGNARPAGRGRPGDRAVSPVAHHAPKGCRRRPSPPARAADPAGK